jgi:GntR family histidine utilization transcriptional repressor
MSHGKPRYQQLKDLIISRISSGELQPSDRVPSENELVEAMRVLQQSRQRARGEIAKALHIEQGTDVIHLLLVHTENDTPVQLEDRYIVASFAPGCLEQDFESLTPSAYLTGVAPLQEAEQIVRASMPNGAVRQHLRMADDEPSLVVIRRTWSRGRPVTFARLHHPGSRYELTGHYTPPGTPRSTAADVVQLEAIRQ